MKGIIHIGEKHLTASLYHQDRGKELQALLFQLCGLRGVFVQVDGRAGQIEDGQLWRRGVGFFAIGGSITLGTPSPARL